MSVRDREITVMLHENHPLPPAMRRRINARKKDYVHFVESLVAEVQQRTAIAGRHSARGRLRAARYDQLDLPVVPPRGRIARGKPGPAIYGNFFRRRALKISRACHPERGSSFACEGAGESKDPCSWQRRRGACVSDLKKWRLPGQGSFDSTDAFASERASYADYGSTLMLTARVSHD